MECRVGLPSYRSDRGKSRSSRVIRDTRTRSQSGQVEKQINFVWGFSFTVLVEGKKKGGGDKNTRAPTNERIPLTKRFQQPYHPHLYEHPHRVPVIDVLALAKLGYIRVERDKCVRRAEVQRVVDAPVDLRKK